MDALDTEPPGEDDALIASRVRFLAGLACLNSVALGFQIGAVSAAAPLIQDAVSFGYYMLMVGVCVVGVAVGFGLSVDPIYIAEISPQGDRGYFVTWSEIAITGGQVLGFAAGSSSRLFFVVVGLVAHYYRSPRWLAIHGRVDEARAVLAGLGLSRGAVDRTLEDIAEEQSIAPAEDASVVGLLTQRRALKPAVKRILLVGVGAAVAQQLSGCDAIFYNFLFSLEAVGINSTWISYSILLGLGVVKLCTAILSCHLLDSVGRRPLILASATGTAATLYVLALFYAFCTTLKGNVAYQAGIIFFYYVYIFVFELGLGPGCWLIPSEVFYNAIRMRAMTLATFANRCTTTGVVATAISIEDAWSWAGYFAWYASTAAAGAAFLWIYLPETKGKSLETMYAHFEAITGSEEHSRPFTPSPFQRSSTAPATPSRRRRARPAASASIVSPARMTRGAHDAVGARPAVVRVGGAAAAARAATRPGRTRVTRQLAALDAKKTIMGRDDDRDRDRSRRDRSRERSRRDRSRSRDRSRRDRSRREKSADKAAAEPAPAPAPKESIEMIRQKSEIDDLTKDQRTVFVSQLVMKATEKQIRKFFEKVGKVKDVIMIRDKYTNRHKGFAYVEMADLESVPMVLMLNGTVADFQRFPILVKASEAEKNFLAKQEATAAQQEAAEVSRAAAAPRKQLLVGNLHPNITESDLRTVLAPFGAVDAVDMGAVAPGSAVVTFVHADDAAKASSRIAGIELGADKPITVEFYDDPALAGGGVSSSDWRLDSDVAGGGGVAMDPGSRAALMEQLGRGAAMPGAPGAGAPPPPPPPQPAAPPPLQGPATAAFVISNMFDPATETDPTWRSDIRDDVTAECGKRGRRCRGAAPTAAVRRRM
ncbi:hypothetical protein JL722_7750 [Aureococcus anophagefferens]|nr:hypothetical protein JL722_7750 [Aureococcus anophagefferens]